MNSVVELLQCCCCACLLCCCCCASCVEGSNERLRDKSTALLATYTPTPYCGFCLFPLPQGAQRCENFLDRRTPQLPEWRDRYSLGLEHIQASGSRGCVVCSAIYKTLVQKYPEPGGWGLDWNEFGECFELWEKTEGGTRKGQDTPQFRLLSDISPAADLGFPHGHPYIIKHPNSSGRSDLETAGRLVQLWIENCLAGHDQCKPPVENPPLPTRVIQITDSDSDFPITKLVETEGRHGEYVCLSHCWGQIRPNCLTTRETYGRNTSEIPKSSLPQTFQDAVILTKLLGKEFIWIDSICIIQEDEADWRRESAKMCSIYENSFLTIMATKARDGRGGLLNSSPPFIVGEIPGALTAGQLFFREQAVGGLRWDGPKLDTESAFDLYPLLRRAWVLQERYLSPRAIHFTSHGLYYECLAGSQSDWFMGVDSHNSKSPRGSSAPPASAPDFAKKWADIVTSYSRLDMTFERDKLPALAGIARRLASNTISETYPGHYLAGLWEGTFSSELMWKSDDHVRSSEWVAPSWSWASMRGSISTSYRSCDATLKECKIQHKGTDEFGQLDSLSVKIVTHPLRGRLRHTEGPAGRHYASYKIVTPVEYYWFWPDEGMDEEWQRTIADDIEVLCLRVPRDGEHADACLVLQAVDGSSDTFRRIGVIDGAGDAVGTRKLAEQFQGLPEVTITLV
ncbi:hypothetical protein G7Y89_g3210 [Cudoniella acicularis]|uniref:Heterokaryon incompatibility domain-containing protein n=1 Tax=Cudoniella acicularis TaxID=354080 RepID=A0A8H4W8L6_9HELO|nr:hypothetical protein G7Y89_g3210 [Cudoniella acicularis]